MIKSSKIEPSLFLIPIINVIKNTYIKQNRPQMKDIVVTKEEFIF